MELNDREIDQLNQGRMVRAEADVVLPLLGKQKLGAVAKISTLYRAGDLGQLPVAVAELVAIENLETEINKRIKRAEALERRIFE